MGQQAGTTGYGGTTGTTGYTTTGAAGTTGTGQAHFVENPATGELNKHSTKAGAKMDEAWQKTKAAIPGTQAHAATHPKTTNM